jgi:ABC-2 type transport system ATP-binding protein
VPAVEARGLVKTFGTNRAVDGIDLTVAEGEIFGVLGPNGAGKTTMLQMLATLLPIDSGDARIFGYDVRRQSHAVRQLIGVTGQYASVDELLTGRENLRLFGWLQGLSSKEARSIGDDLLARFDLTEAADRFVTHYSGGMRRRLDLAASLITRPALIFLDEPTTGLDPRTRGLMWETIRGLVADGCTILLTTQYLEEADQLADRIAVIDRGRKVAEGTSDELKAQVGGSSLRVQLADGGDARAAVAVASEVSHHVPVLSPTGTGFSVALSDANQAADVLIALRQRGMDIGNAAIEQPTLDEVFMALTGHPGATSTPDPEANAA